MVYALQEKSNYPSVYQTLNKPTTILQGINGQLYDENNRHINDSDVMPILLKYSEKLNNSSFIIKPTGSFGGKGVKKINIEEINASDIFPIFNATGRCFVCQESVKQSKLTSAFNQTSLNTFRINTLNINGQITVTNILFRHGRNGAIVDNGGSGGICCGVRNNGEFTGLAYDMLLNKYVDAPSGIPYKDITIQDVKNLVEYAINAHRLYLPMIGHAAWDFGLDEADKPIFIEVNLGWPGIVIEQLACKSPIYGERTEEVINYVSKNKHKLAWTEFTGGWI